MLHGDDGQPAIRSLLPAGVARLSFAAGLYAFAGGLVSFAAWPLDLPAFADWEADGISTQPNAGLAAIFAGAALVCVSLGRMRRAAVLGVAPGLLGAVTLFEHLTGVDLGIDRLFLFERTWGGALTMVPGRMGMPGSISWTLVGVAIFLLARGPRARRAAAALGIVVAAIASLSVTGYLFGADGLYSLPRLTAIAFQTATMLLAVGLGLVAAVPERQPMRGLLDEGAAGVFIRRTLPFLVILPLAIGLLRLEGEEAGLYDTRMGVAVLVLLNVASLCAVLWWGAAAVRHHERALADTAERVRTATAHSEQRFRSLVSILTDVPWTTDATGAFAEPQPAWTAYTGQPWEDLRGFGWLDAVHPEDRERVRRVWEDAVKRGVVYEAHARLWHAGTGSYRDVFARGTPLRDGRGDVLEWVGCCTDVTAERRAAAEREELLAAAERAREAAEVASRAKDDFLAVLSHELRAPLNAMLGWVRVLELAGADEDTARRALETLRRNVWAQARVVDDLLDISRIVSGKVSLERRRVELGSLVAEGLESLRPVAAAKRVELALETSPDRLDVDGDPGRLRQVVANVLHNAIKFTPPGGGVRVQLAAHAGLARMTVEDDGEGIPADLLPYVFDRFVQAGTGTTRRHGGLGLGLALVKELVALHGGEVRAESEGPGRGARFTVSLPLATGAPEPAPARAAPERQAGGDLGALELLVVDDDADSREALGLALQRAGARVRLAGSVREALDAWRAAPADVLVSDIAMPDVDGYALVRAIRAGGRAPGAIAIAMTGLASRHDREAAIRAGFDDHVGKPVDVERLIECVRAWLGAREAGALVAVRAAAADVPDPPA